MITNIEFKKLVDKPQPTNHVFVVDVSYSMARDLPKIQKHLKNNLAALVKPDDTVSILYFSSKGKYGSVFVGERVSSLDDLSGINQLIDRYLKPIGCTGFVEPLKLAYDVALSDLANGNMNSLIFMTDGYDNEWTDSEILANCAQLPSLYQSITFMEYGYHCNRALLDKMTAAVNADHVFIEDYSGYEPEFESLLTATTSPRVPVDMGTCTHAVFVDSGKVSIVGVTPDGVAYVPAHVDDIIGVDETSSEALDSVTDDNLLYTLLYFAVHSMNPDLAWAVLRKLGDVRLIKAYDNCFTKQDYSNAKALIESAVVSEDQRYVEGIDYNMVPDDNAPTLIDALEILADGCAEVDIRSPEFSYNRTGKKTEQKEDDTIDKLADQMTAATTKEERRAIALQMAEHQDWTPVFNVTDNTIEVNTLVYNLTRPNVSLNTIQHGYVDIPEWAQELHNLPSKVDSHQFRNYTIVRDGIVNMKKIPVIIEFDTLERLMLECPMIELKQYSTDYVTGSKVAAVIDLLSLPLVNRSMTRNLNGKKFLENHVNLEVQKATQKVLKAYRNELIGQNVANSVKLAGLYGDDAAKFLSDNGVRDYGFSPKVATTPADDFYMSKELNVKIKGLSSLPALNAVQKKVDTNKKLNAADQLIRDAVLRCEAQKVLMSADEFSEWISESQKQSVATVRGIQKELSKVMYGVVVGHGFFSDIDFEDAKQTVVVDGLAYDCTIELEEKQVKI